MKKHRIRISQCMIVKNEEKNICQALSWGKKVMWEQIVVDTGSTDRTVELAESMGAKVYHFAWINDFSAAKNFAISKAKGDWIAFLDADEYMPEEWAQKLPALLDQIHDGQYCALRTLLANIDASGKITSTVRHCRIFKRLKGLQYRNAIHENLALNGTILSSRYIVDAEEQFPIYHTGYAAEVMKEKNKRQRNLELLKLQLEKTPEDYNLMGYMGDMYNRGSEDQAEYWYRKAVNLFPEKFSQRDERSASTYIYLLILLTNKNKENELLEMYDVAIERMPWVYDLDYVVGYFYLKNENYEKALYHLEKAMQTIEEYGTMAYGVYLYGNIEGFWEKLILCYYQTEDFSSCVRFCVNFLKENNQNITILALLLKSLEKEKPEAVVRFLGNLYDIHQLSDRVCMIKGAIRGGAEGVLEALKPLCGSEELEYIEQAREVLADKKDIASEIKEDFLPKGDVHEAT